MGTLMPATPTQTLYVSVRRDELRQLKDERDQLRQQVAHLNQLLEQARLQGTSDPCLKTPEPGQPKMYFQSEG